MTGDWCCLLRQHWHCLKLLWQIIPTDLPSIYRLLKQPWQIQLEIAESCQPLSLSPTHYIENWWIGALLSTAEEWDTCSASFSDEISDTLPRRLFHYLKIHFSGSKYLKIILFEFENRSTVHLGGLLIDNKETEKPCYDFVFKSKWTIFGILWSKDPFKPIHRLGQPENYLFFYQEFFLRVKVSGKHFI